MGDQKVREEAEQLKSILLQIAFVKVWENELYSLKLRYICLRIYMGNFTLAIGVRGKDEREKKNTNQTIHPLF